MEQEVYDFGLRLKKLREEMGLTQQFVADRLEVSIWSVQNYEKNEQLPPIDKLEKMALMYRTSLDYLRNLDKRKAVYIDDLSQSRQILVLDVIDAVRKEQNSNEKSD